jgi:hypothetical protein
MTDDGTKRGTTVVKRVPSRRRALSDDDLQRLLELTRKADSVELKLTLSDDDIRSTVAALGMDPLEARIRQVYFFDTPDLRLSKHGVVVRARRVQGRDDDSVVKLRPIDPAELPASVRRSRNLVVEVDAMPGGYVCSATLKSNPAAGGVKAVAAGGKPVRSLFSKEQRAFFAAHAPTDLELDDLSLMGPVNLLKLKFSPDGLPRRMVAELWLYPDASRILELSTKCPPAEAFQAAAESRAWLAARGVDLTGAQQTKTRAALTYFSRALTARTATPAGSRRATVPGSATASRGRAR